MGAFPNRVPSRCGMCVNGVGTNGDMHRHRNSFLISPRENTDVLPRKRDTALHTISNLPSESFSQSDSLTRRTVDGGVHVLCCFARHTELAGADHLFNFFRRGTAECHLEVMNCRR